MPGPCRKQRGTNSLHMVHRDKTIQFLQNPLLWQQCSTVPDTQLPGYPPIDPSCNDMIEIGMNGIDRNVPLDGGDHRSLHIRASCESLKSLKDDRMMRHDQVTATGCRFLHHSFRDI